MRARSVVRGTPVVDQTDARFPSSASPTLPRACGVALSRLPCSTVAFVAVGDNQISGWVIIVIIMLE